MHSTEPYTCRISTREALTAMKDLSSGAFKLLIYYNSKSTGWDFQNSEIADTIGVSERRLVILTKELIDKRYLYITKSSDLTVYFIGRQQVMDWLDPDTEQTGDNHEQ